MKIYNRRSFAGGILALALAVGCGIALVFQGFQMRLLVSLMLLLALGGADIAWSLPREARLPRGDERDRAVSQKSAWRAFLILTNGCFMVSLVLLFLYAAIRSAVLLTAALTLCAVVAAAFLILLGVNWYYEKRM